MAGVRVAVGATRAPRQVIGPCHHDGMPSRLTALVATLALVATAAACSGEDAPAEKEQDARSTAASSTPTVPPTPSEALGLVEGWGPDRAELDRAAKVASRMRLPDLAGQVIVADWSGTRAPVAMVRDLHLGGVIAFSSNVASADQVRGVNAALTRQVRRKWPLFLSVDQEGGVVERLRGAASRFPTFMSAGAAGDPALTQQAYAASGAELRGLGFTVDFAPDADVTSGPGDPTIGSRSVSSRPATVAEHVVAAADGFSGAGVLPVIKHFPGHGSVPADSHLTLPVQTKSLADLEASDLVPFREAVDGGPARGDGGPPRRARGRPARAVVAVAQGHDRPAPRRAGVRRAGGDRLAPDGRRHPRPVAGTYGGPGDPRRRRRAAHAAVARGGPRRTGEGGPVGGPPAAAPRAVGRPPDRPPHPPGRHRGQRQARRIRGGCVPQPVRRGDHRHRRRMLRPARRRRRAPLRRPRRGERLRRGRRPCRPPGAAAPLPAEQSR